MEKKYKGTPWEMLPPEALSEIATKQEEIRVRGEREGNTDDIIDSVIESTSLKDLKTDMDTFIESEVTEFYNTAYPIAMKIVEKHVSGCQINQDGIFGDIGKCDPIEKEISDKFQGSYEAGLRKTLKRNLLLRITHILEE